MSFVSAKSSFRASILVIVYTFRVTPPPPPSPLAQARTEARLGRAEAWFHEHMLLTVAADDAKAGQDDAMAVAADDAKAGAQDDPMAGALAVAPPTKTVFDLSAVDNGRLNRFRPASLRAEPERLIRPMRSYT